MIKLFLKSTVSSQLIEEIPWKCFCIKNDNFFLIYSHMHSYKNYLSSAYWQLWSLCRDFLSLFFLLDYCLLFLELLGHIIFVLWAGYFVILEDEIDGGGNSPHWPWQDLIFLLWPFWVLLNLNAEEFAEVYCCILFFLKILWSTRILHYLFVNIALPRSGYWS